MAIFNFGSINIDHVYRVPHLVRPGETLASSGFEQLLGGKGANQSVALARAGASVRHVGRLGRADAWARDSMANAGVDVSLVALVDGLSGHAIIQVDDAGENAIVLHGGANQSFDADAVDACLEAAVEGDWLLLQNECSGMQRALALAEERGLRLAMNPAPMTADIAALPLENCRVLILNEGEARGLADPAANADGDARAIQGIIHTLRQRYPETVLVLTLGGDGAVVCENTKQTQVDAWPVDAVDTTGAGDTFVGYFLAAFVDGDTADDALRRGCAAAALSVTRAGATSSIPDATEVARLLEADDAR